LKNRVGYLGQYGGSCTLRESSYWEMYLWWHAECDKSRLIVSI
jgi:hypothetical protein